MKKLDIKHYVAKLKEHEANRLSTDQRTAYWEKYHAKSN